MRPASPDAPAQTISSVLAELVDRVTARLQAGEEVDVEALARERPEHAQELMRLLPALGALAELSHSRSACPLPVGGEEHPGMLGDFRIIREVGRGGMGIVYEAEQISLGRRVALKVLPYAAVMDPRALQRFQNEARAAACLHHPHIVPVHAVGQERGVHFYAMQFIDGQSLAELIASQRQPANGPPPPPRTDDRTTAYAPTLPAAAVSTEQAPRDAGYFRRVAEWGIQAAEALEYAHSLGIVHRDIKPGNLMIDERGALWVADFGLARTAADSGLTMTGDLLGTLRYMSPEQALANHGLVDHRTDVYALGATLYELLTLRPVFAGERREELLRQVAFEGPLPPRRWCPEVPLDLETIVLKAITKEPEGRYQSAQELANDLRLFLEDRPIKATRPSWFSLAWSWARRHHGIATTAAVGLLAVTLVSLVSTVVVLFYLQEAKKQRVAAEESEQRAVGLAKEAALQSQRSERYLDDALAAWGTSLRAFQGLPPEKDTSELANVRQALARRSGEFNLRLIREIEAHPERRAEAARSYAQLAKQCFFVGGLHDGKKAAESGISLFRQILADHPADAKHHANLVALYEAVLRAANNGPNFLQLSIRTGDLLTWLARSNEAIELYSLVPADAVPLKRPDARTRLVAEPHLLWLAAEALYKVGNSKKAAQLLGRSAELWRTAPQRFPGQVYPAFFKAGEARALALRGQCLVSLGREADAAGEYRAAKTIYDAMSPLDIQMMECRADHAALEQARGELLWKQDQRKAAIAAFTHAEALLRQVAKGTNVDAIHQLAWFLGTCPCPTFRNDKEFLSLTEQAVKAKPEQALYLRAHGLALLRAGQYARALKVINQGMKDTREHTGLDLLFRALAQWHLGQKDHARGSLKLAVEWANAHNPDGPLFARSRKEAEDLIGANPAPPR